MVLTPSGRVVAASAAREAAANSAAEAAGEGRVITGKNAATAAAATTWQGSTIRGKTERLKAAVAAAREIRRQREAARAEAYRAGAGERRARAAEAALRAEESRRVRQTAHQDWKASMADAAEEAAEMRRNDRADLTEVTWYRLKGSKLEKSSAGLKVHRELGEAPIRLLDARFLLELAASPELRGPLDGTRRAGLPRRQELPEAAFIDLYQLRHMTESGFGALRILCVSWPWLQPDHPDPRADHLRTLAHVVSMFLSDRIFQSHQGTYAVMLDWCCVMQPAPAQSGEAMGERTPKEQALYKLAVDAMVRKRAWAF